jgi:EAL domain-containing protein (putative c-di-GMP-specific phosphodiesterase class I)
MNSPLARPPSQGPIVDLLANGVGQTGVDRVLKTVRKYLGMDVAFIAHFGEKDRVFEHVDAEIALPIAPGMRLPMEVGYCAKVVRGELPRLIPDTSLVPAAMSIPETTALPIGSHLSVPILLDNGEVYGTLCCFSRHADLTLGEREMKMMEAFAEVLATSIGETQRVQANREQRAEQIRRMIAAGDPRMVYQPVYRLRTGEVAGMECLARFDAEPNQPPDRWFAMAHEAGMGPELELAAIRKALASLGRFPARIFLGLNGSPDLIVSGELEPALTGLDLRRILLEITEHAIVENYQDLESALRPLRKRGLRLAIDDAGAGYASMRHIVNLHPDLIKLDISLVRNIDSDHSRRSLAKALTGFARDIGSIVSAEGVETAGELEILRELGVDKAQGYFLSRPLPLEAALQAAPLDVRNLLQAQPA